MSIFQTKTKSAVLSALNILSAFDNKEDNRQVVAFTFTEHSMYKELVKILYKNAMKSDPNLDHIKNLLNRIEPAFNALVESLTYATNAKDTENYVFIKSSDKFYDLKIKTDVENKIMNAKQAIILDFDKNGSIVKKMNNGKLNGWLPKDPAVLYFNKENIRADYWIDGNLIRENVQLNSVIEPLEPDYSVLLDFIQDTKTIKQLPILEENDIIVRPVDLFGKVPGYGIYYCDSKIQTWMLKNQLPTFLEHESNLSKTIRVVSFESYANTNKTFTRIESFKDNKLFSMNSSNPYLSVKTNNQDPSYFNMEKFKIIDNNVKIINKNSHHSFGKREINLSDDKSTEEPTSLKF